MEAIFEHIQPISLEGYIKNPLVLPFHFKFEADGLEHALNSLLETPRFLPHLLLKRLRHFCRLLGTIKNISPFALKILPTLKPTAFMKDGGDLYFSLGALLSRSSDVTLAVLCHEYGHILLSNQPFYGDLKKVNRQFKKEFAHSPFSELLSPIELYAVLISINLMKSLLPLVKQDGHKKKLSLLIQQEQDKIGLLNSEIIKLRKPQ